MVFGRVINGIIIVVQDLLIFLQEIICWRLV